MLELVSVIVPVYNVERYLPKCLDSIINQTYKNLEIILVDDGSTDNSGNICDEYAAKDKRIKVIHKENGGQALARNIAIDIAQGSYINFMDSDDYMDLNTIELLYNALFDSGADISVCNFFFQYEKDNNITQTANKTYPENKIFNKSAAMSEMLYQRSFDVSPWGKLFKINLFKNIRFPEGKIYEDFAALCRIVSVSNKVVVIPDRLYYYLIRDNSTMTTGFSEKKLDLIEIAEDVLQFISKNMPECLKAARYRKLASCFHVYYFLPKHGYKELEIKLKNMIKPLRREVLFDKNAVRNVRLSCLLSYLSFEIVPLYKRLKAKKRS